MDRSDMRRRLDDARVGRLATVSFDGHPHLVPVCFALVADTLYHAVDHKPKRSDRLRRLVNIEATGLASLLVDEYREDWSALWWVRVDGGARVVTSVEEVETAIASLVRKYEQYAHRPPAGPVLALDARHWSAWP